jgi:hypothetical protein
MLSDRFQDRPKSICLVALILLDPTTERGVLEPLMQWPEMRKWTTLCLESDRAATVLYLVAFAVASKFFRGDYSALISILLLASWFVAAASAFRGAGDQRR